MLLTAKQNQSLITFIKTGFVATTISTLEELSQRNIKIKIKDISLNPVHRLGNKFAPFVDNEVATIHQIFSGSISGDALFLLDYTNALSLCNSLRDPSILPSPQLDFDRRDILTEVGNIILNNYLGMFSELLQLQVNFCFPCFRLEPLPKLINQIVIGKNEIRYSLVIETDFNFSDRSVMAYLILVSGVLSLSCLIHSVETWADLTNLNFSNTYEFKV
jgi:chemotaxis protein CheC